MMPDIDIFESWAERSAARLREENADLRRQLAEAQVEVERYVHWVNDLQAGTYVTCVYCGHNYGPDDVVPTAFADVLKQHIEHCPQHPMSILKAEHETLQHQYNQMFALSKSGADTIDVVDDRRRGLEVERIRLKDQVAVMAEALAICHSFIGGVQDELLEPNDIEAGEEAIDAIEQALSAAPKVCWHETGEWRKGEDVGSGDFDIVGSQVFELRKLGTELAGQGLVNVLVIECPRHPEQPQESEQSSEQSSLVDTFAELGRLVGQGLASIDDVEAWVREIRGSEEEG